MKTLLPIKSLFLLYVTLSLFVTACTPTYYAPGTLPTPGLKNKGEVKFAVHKSESSDEESTSIGSGMDVEIAYSPIQNLGLVFHSNRFSDSFQNPIKRGSGLYGFPEYEYVQYTAKGDLYNFGVGYYKNLHPSLVWETYGTVGLGSFDMRELTADLRKTAIQSGVVYANDIFECGIHLGLASLKYRNIQGDVTNYDESQNQYLNENSDNVLANTALTVRLGYRPVKIQLQVGGSENLTNPDFKMNDNYASCGLFFDVSELFKKQ